MLGLLYCFIGYRLFRPTLFIAGFFISAQIAFSIMSTTNTFAHMDDQKWMYLIAILVGFVGGSLAICFWTLGVYLIGALLGYVLYNTLVAVVNISSIIVQILLIVLFCTIVAVMVHFF